MMISKNINDKEAFVWIWLPGEISPVVAGKIFVENERFNFTYGRSYLERDNAISIYEDELPLKSGLIEPINNLSIPGCIRDSLPDAWGRRVINSLISNLDNWDVEISNLAYMLFSGSDRIGALDFQKSANYYEPRALNQCSLEELLSVSTKVERGIPIDSSLENALLRGASVGGARPKMLFESQDQKYIAKFSKTTDHYDVVKAEFIVMRLAKYCGLNVAKVELTETLGKSVILVERFDRKKRSNEWERRLVFTAQTLLGLPESTPLFGSYQKFAEIIRHKFTEPLSTLEELFARIVFNILCGNTDDHLRNHSVFWDGTSLTLTPAYDVCTFPRSGGEAKQLMQIYEGDRSSRISLCIKAAHQFRLSQNRAKEIIDSQVSCIESNWQNVCDEAQLPETERKLLWGRGILNPYVFEE